MTLPHRLIIDGVEQCASDDMDEFLRKLVYLYLGDAGAKEVKMVIDPESGERRKATVEMFVKSRSEPTLRDGGVPRDGWCHKGYPEYDE